MSDFQNNGASNAQTPTVEKKPSNKVGVAGFVCALLGPIIIVALAVASIDFDSAEAGIILGCIVSGGGLILSIVGLFKKPKGWAIAGLIISVIIVIIFLVALASVPRFRGSISPFDFM